MKKNQKADISCISVESCILDVTWGVIFCRRRYLLSGWYQHEEYEVDDEHDNDEYVRIEGRRGRGWSEYALIE